MVIILCIKHFTGWLHLLAMVHFSGIFLFPFAKGIFWIMGIKCVIINVYEDM